MNKEMVLELDETGGLRGFLRKVANNPLLSKTIGHLQIAEDTQGGFVVPEQFEPELLGYGYEGSIVRPRARLWDMKTEKVIGPRYVETDRSSGELYGGLIFRWIKERADKSVYVSKPSLGAVKLEAHKLIALIWCSDEVIADAKSFDRFLRNILIPGASFIQDQVFISGSGVNQPLGILNATATIDVPRWTAGQVNQIDLARMAVRLTPESWNGGTACWIFSQQTLEQIFELSATAANVSATFMLNDRTLFGLPIFISSTASALGTRGDVILADFGQGYYIIGDRSTEIASSFHQDKGEGHYGFRTDEILFRLVIRMDGQPGVDAPIIPANGGETVSPFVVLSTTTS